MEDNMEGTVSDAVGGGERAGRGGGGRKAGAKGYKAVEIMKLLKIIEALQPVGQEGWRRVTDLYNKWAGENGVSEREMENLRKKYKSLTRYKPEEGVTQTPEEVREARRIERLILDRISGKTPVPTINGGMGFDGDDSAENGEELKEGLGEDENGRRRRATLDFGMKPSGSLEHAVLSLVEKLDQQNKDFKELQNMIRQFLESHQTQQSTMNSLLQQNQHLVMILVQAQKNTPMYLNTAQPGGADGNT